jgi:transcription antitermination protein NusB
MGLRRRSREKALQILYSAEFNKSLSIKDAIDIYYQYFNLTGKCQGSEGDTEEYNFIVYLLGEVEKNTAQIEKLIEDAAINWRIERIALIERNILRMSVAELIDTNNGVPFKATINEAIDIAKKFGSRDSSSFVNGIINKVADIIDVKSTKL